MWYQQHFTVGYTTFHMKKWGDFSLQTLLIPVFRSIHYQLPIFIEHQYVGTLECLLYLFLWNEWMMNVNVYATDLRQKKNFLSPPARANGHPVIIALYICWAAWSQHYLGSLIYELQPSHRDVYPVGCSHPAMSCWSLQTCHFVLPDQKACVAFDEVTKEGMFANSSTPRISQLLSTGCIFKQVIICVYYRMNSEFSTIQQTFFHSVVSLVGLYSRLRSRFLLTAVVVV